MQSFSALHTLFSWQGGLALAISILASYVTLDMARRVQISKFAIGLRWLGGAAVALGEGITASQVLLCEAQNLPDPMTYAPWHAVFANLLGMLIVFATLLLAGGRVVTARRVMIGGVALGLGIGLVQLVGMRAMNLHPGAWWDWTGGAIFIATTTYAFLPALWVFYRVRLQPKRQEATWLALSALLLGSALCLTQLVAISGAHLSNQHASSSALGLPMSTMIALATLGSVSLLCMMLVSSLLEAQVRRSLRRARTELQMRTSIDLLTGLPTRLTLEAALASAIKEADAAGHSLALLAIDIDGFNPVNELHGHVSGDQVLREVGQRLKKLARVGDTVARMGSDEFLWLMCGV